MSTQPYTELLKVMLLEDWRHHTDLFGKIRFAAFPFQITAIVGVTAWLLTLTTLNTSTIIAGLHALVLVFGLHIGTTAFEGDDAMKNALGDTTYTLFTARTLPITTRELLAVFLVKDAIYYTGLFVLPATVGSLPLLAATPGGVSATLLGTLLVSLSATFIAGAALAVLFISLLSGSVLKRFTALGALAGVTGGVVTGVIPVEATTYGIYTASTGTDAIVPVLGVIALVVVATLAYSPNKHVHSGPPMPYPERLLTSLPGDRPRVALKSVMDIHRSSAGFLKPASVAALIVAVVALSTWGVENTLHISINTGIAYGGLLSLTAFTTHTFLTQYDDIEEYLFHPLSVRDVFHAKFIAFVLVMIPTGAVFYGAAIVYHVPVVLDAVTGAIVFTGLSLYVFGVTVFLTGVDPNGFMFDTVAFSAFSVAVMIAIVPVLLSSFIPLTIEIAVLLIAWSAVLAIVGYIGMKRAPMKWSEKHLE